MRNSMHSPRTLRRVRRGRTGLVAAAAVLLAACGPHVARVTVTPRPRGTSVRAPTFILSGDSLAVFVRDPDWSNAYAIQVNEAARTEIPRAPIFGVAQGLSDFTKTFPLGEGSEARSVSSAAMARAEGASPPDEFPQAALDSAQRLLASGPRGTAAARRLWLQSLERAYGRIAAYRDEMATHLDGRTGSVNEALEDLHRHLAAAPADIPILRFLADTAAHRILHDFATNGFAAGLRQRLALAMAGAAAFDSASVDSAFDQVGEYARRLKSVAALVPTVPDPNSAGPASELGQALANLRANLQLRDEDSVRYEQAQTAAARLEAAMRAAGVGLPSERAPQVRMAPLVAAGVPLRGLLKTQAEGDWLASLREDFFAIDENSRTVADVSQQLPRWVTLRDSLLAYGHVFQGSETLTVKLWRHPRYSALEFRPAPSAARVDATDGAPSTSGTDGSPPGVADPSAPTAKPEMDSVATFTVLLVQRYRFHVGAGFVYSPLQTHTYATVTDTVDGVVGQRTSETAFARNAVYPAMVISYALLPTAGRVFDGTVSRNRLDFGLSGLSLQAGMSLKNPTEQLYFGLSTEPLPGLALGGGYSLSYLDRSHVGEFVPASAGSAVRKRWIGKWGAFSLTLDADVFMKTIGALLK